MKLMLSIFCSLCVLSAAAQDVDLSNSHATSAKQSGTFVCTSGLSIPINSFYFELPSSSAPGASASYLVSVTTDISQFSNLFIAAATGKAFESCDVHITEKSAESGPLQLIDVSAQLVSITADKQTQYVTATFHYSKVKLIEANASASVKHGPTSPLDQQNKAITEFLARAPKPSANRPTAN